MSSLNPGAASFNVNSQTLQFQMTLDSTSNDVIAGDVVTLLSNGNVRRADNGTVLPAIFDTNAVSSTPPSVAELTSTTFVVAYKGASNYVYAVIGTITGNAISYGAVTAINAVSSGAISVSALSSTSFVISYTDNNSYPNAVVCTVSGTTITVGTPTVLNSVSSANGTGVAALSSTSFAVVYTGTSNYVNVVVCTVSGTTITEGTPVVLNAVASTLVCISGLSSSLFVASYYGGSSTRLTAVACTVSGTTITNGAALQLIGGSLIQAIAIAALDAPDFVVAAIVSGTGPRAIVGSVSGTTITAGAQAALGGNNYGAAIGVCSSSSTSFVVAVRPNSGAGLYCIANTQSGGTVTPGTLTNVDSEPYGSFGIALAGMSLGLAVCAVCNIEGRAICVPYSGLTVTYAAQVPSNTIGVAASSATGGNNLDVVSIGVTATNISYTLTIGTQYYWDDTVGKPSTNSSYPYSLGVALNTQLLLVARVTGANQYFG